MLSIDHRLVGIIISLIIILIALSLIIIKYKKNK